MNKDGENHFGLYLAGYLSDMDFSKATESNGKHVTKSIARGAKLHLYPARFNMFQCSKGNQKPTRGTNKSALKIQNHLNRESRWKKKKPQDSEVGLDEGFEFAKESPLIAKPPHLVSLSSD